MSKPARQTMTNAQVKAAMIKFREPRLSNVEIGRAVGVSKEAVRKWFQEDGPPRTCLKTLIETKGKRLYPPSGARLTPAQKAGDEVSMALLYKVLAFHRVTGFDLADQDKFSAYYELALAGVTPNEITVPARDREGYDELLLRRTDKDDF